MHKIDLRFLSDCRLDLPFVPHKVRRKGKYYLKDKSRHCLLLSAGKEHHPTEFNAYHYQNCDRWVVPSFICVMVSCTRWHLCLCFEWCFIINGECGMALLQRDIHLLFHQSQRHHRLLYHRFVPITMSSAKPKVKHSHCFVNIHYVYDNSHKSSPDALLKGNCRQTYFSAKDNPASFTAAVKNR